MGVRGHPAPIQITQPPPPTHTQNASITFVFLLFNPITMDQWIELGYSLQGLVRLSVYQVES